MIHRTSRLGRGVAVGLIVLAAWATQSFAAPVEATITTKDGREAQGLIVWKADAKAYEFRQAGSATSLSLRPDVLAKIVVRPPADLAEAVKAVQGPAFAKAIPALSRIVDEYAMLQYDVVAARWLAEAYQKSGDAKAAVAVCEKAIGANPSAMSSADLLSVYVENLTAVGSTAKAKELLGQVIERGARPAAAVAQLRRADMELKDGNVKEALIDGYLRTAVLFQDVKQVQPEALYKAALCFEKLGQNTEAETLRRRLMAEYPDDPYAAKAKAGA